MEEEEDSEEGDLRLWRTFVRRVVSACGSRRHQKTNGLDWSVLGRLINGVLI